MRVPTVVYPQSTLATSWYRLMLLLVLLTLALLAVVHSPLSYAIDVGVEEGYGGDLPLLWHFNTAEDDDHGTYRWTQETSTIHLPALGHRPVVVRLDVLPINAQVVTNGPTHIALDAGNESLARLPVYARGQRYHLLVPAHRMDGGHLTLTMHTTTFTPPDDPRHLGSPLDTVRVTSVKTPFPTMPAWGTVAQWVGAVLLFWIIVFFTRSNTPHPHRWALWCASGAAVLVALAALLDPPRWGYGAQPALVATALALVLVVTLRPALAALAQRLHIPLHRDTLGWLLLLVALAFGLRFGGRLFPLSMWGDLGFHTNRFIETLGLGEVYLLSRNRGVNFPYPPGPYITLAPLILTHLDIRIVLQLVAALVDALSAPLVYALVVVPLAGERPTLCYQRNALLAAALYVLTAAGFMLTWWSFDTHIYSQAAALLLVTTLVFLGCRTQAMTRNTAHTALIALLLCGIFLGHFGFLINTVLMGGLLLLVAWVAAWRGSRLAATLHGPLLLAYLAAGLFALFFFYSAYLWLFKDQVAAMSQGGLTGLAQRAPVPRSRLWRVLWEAGLIQHFGFFPLLLLPVGIWGVWRQKSAGEGRGILLSLMLSSILVSSCFAVLPFITQSTQSTRWLMFSAWAIAVGGALAMRWLWRIGYAGRVVTLVMGAFVVWNTATFWLGPMLWRIRPPEPF